MFWCQQTARGGLAGATRGRSLRILFLAASLPVMAAPAVRAAPEVPVRPTAAQPDNIMTVTGTAEVKTPPDAARVALGVEVNARTAAQATSQEASLMSAVVDAVRKTGVEDRDIQTSQLNLEPVYENGPNVQPKVTGFRVSNVVQVTVHQLDHTGAVVDAALGAGANRVDSISFFKENDDAERQQALQQAARVASGKARAIAEALNINLGDVASVTEGVAEPQPVPYMGVRAVAMAATPSTPVLAGQLTVSATVTVQYHITGQPTVVNHVP